MPLSSSSGSSKEQSFNIGKTTCSKYITDTIICSNGNVNDMPNDDNLVTSAKNE